MPPYFVFYPSKLCTLSTYFILLYFCYSFMSDHLSFIFLLVRMNPPDGLSTCIFINKKEISGCFSRKSSLISYFKYWTNYLFSRGFKFISFIMHTIVHYRIYIWINVLLNNSSCVVHIILNLRFKMSFAFSTLLNSIFC